MIAMLELSCLCFLVLMCLLTLLVDFRDWFMEDK